MNSFDFRLGLFVFFLCLVFNAKPVLSQTAVQLTT
jgi:hypothetical protein